MAVSFHANALVCRVQTLPWGSTGRIASLRCNLIRAAGNGEQGSLLDAPLHSAALRARESLREERLFHDHYAACFAAMGSGSLNSFPVTWRISSPMRRKRASVVTSSSKGRKWKGEPLVKGRVTRRAMHIVKILRSLKNEEGDKVYEALCQWVVSMQPKRRDWLDVLKEFDNKDEVLLFFRITEWGLNERWFEACVRDYTKLIDRYAKNGYLAKAESTFNHMEDRGITAELATYTVMIAAYGRAKMLDKARQVLEEITYVGLRPDAVAYKALIIAYGNAGLPSVAEAVLAEMEVAGVTGIADTYLALITGYGRLGQATEAQRIFDLMHWKGFRGNTKAFTALMEAYSRAHDYENAIVVFGSLRAAGLRPDDRALASLITVYGNAEMLDKAVEVVADLENAGMKLGPLALTSLVGWFGKVGLVEEAKQVLEEIRVQQLPMTSQAYANLFAAFAQDGELDKSDGIWDLIVESGIITQDQGSCATEALLAGQQYNKAEQLCAQLQVRGGERSMNVESPLPQHQEAVC